MRPQDFTVDDMEFTAYEMCERTLNLLSGFSVHVNAIRKIFNKEQIDDDGNLKVNLRNRALESKIEELEE